MRALDRPLLGAAGAFLLLTTSATTSALAAAKADERIDIARCLEVAKVAGKADPARCPSFIVDGMRDAATTCRDVGGKLAPIPGGKPWSIDVNGDGKPEYLFRLDAAVECEGAPSALSCGSSDCPYGLYEQRGGTWLSIGAFGLSSPDAIEVLDAKPGSTHRELRVGCAGGGECNEYTHYERGKDGYEVRRLQVRGHWVKVPASIQGLKGVTREITVRATPAKDGAVLARYGRDTEVVVIGEVSGTPYLYVSPCNACESGFVEKAAIRPN